MVVTEVRSRYRVRAGRVVRVRRRLHRPSADWDPGIHESRKVSGDGGVGTVYEVQAEFRGKTMPFTYTVTALEQDARIVLDGVGEKATSARHDRVRAVDDGGTGSRTRQTSSSRACCAVAEPFLGGHVPQRSRARRSRGSRRGSRARNRGPGVTGRTPSPGSPQRGVRRAAASRSAAGARGGRPARCRPS